MELKEIGHLAIDLMEKHNLFAKGWKFEFDNAKKRAGCCKYRSKTITLSRNLMPYMKDEMVKDTILHEIAHALVGSKHGHNRVWRQKAIEIGCSGDRCYSHNDFINKEQIIAQSKYTATCPTCGKQYPMHRKRKRSSSCGDCSNVYNPEHKLIITQNY